MRIVCLDLEGVLVPEIWIEFAERTGIPELRRTTRDEPNYDTLMKYRLDILAQKKLGLRYLMDVVPLDATLVRGSHGRLPAALADGPLFLCSEPFTACGGEPRAAVESTSIPARILALLGR